jgi:hypothetical protein
MRGTVSVNVPGRDVPSNGDWSVASSVGYGRQRARVQEIPHKPGRHFLSTHCVLPPGSPNIRSRTQRRKSKASVCLLGTHRVPKVYSCLGPGLCVQPWWPMAEITAWLCYLVIYFKGT